MAGFLSENRPIRTLREILTRLRETYCGNIGFEVRAILGDRDQPRHVASASPASALLLISSGGLNVTSAANTSSCACLADRSTPGCFMLWHGMLHNKANTAFMAALRLPYPWLVVLCLQYMHIPDRDRCNWLRERIETPTLVRRRCWEWGRGCFLIGGGGALEHVQS